MILIEWQDNFSIGVPSVDYEHRQLVELINTLHADLSSGSPNYTVMDFLGEIYAKISAHFALEERIMREQQYDEYDAHKADHERLLDVLRDIMDDYEDGACFDEQVLAERLRTWFTEHFSTKDARFHKRLV